MAQLKDLIVNGATHLLNDLNVSGSIKQNTEQVVTKVNNIAPDASGHLNVSIPTVNNATLTINQNNTSKGTFTANSSTNTTINLTDTTYSSQAAANGGTAVSLVTTGEKYTWNNKGTYSKPSGGIPKTDLASAVQTSLEKADTALQSYSETDPVFSASAAAGITSTNISNWNNKISSVKINGETKTPTGGLVDLGVVNSFEITDDNSGNITLSSVDSNGNTRTEATIDEATGSLEFIATTGGTSERVVQIGNVVDNIADYIVEQGAEGIWTYRKWNSGIAECWGRYNMINSGGSAWATPLYYSTEVTGAISYPFTFIEIPNEIVTINSSTNACWPYKESDIGGNTTSKTSSYRAIKVNSFNSAAQTIGFSFYIKGRWK